MTTYMILYLYHVQVIGLKNHSSNFELVKIMRISLKIFKRYSFMKYLMAPCCGLKLLNLTHVQLSISLYFPKTRSTLLQNLILRQLFFLAILLVNFRRVQSMPNNRIGVAETGHSDDGTDYARAAFSDWDTPNGRGALFFADADIFEDKGARTSIGLLKQERAGVEGFGVSHNVITAGLESNGGIMGRVTAFDGTLHTGPVDFSAGVGFDTGFAINDGVEVKVGGLGGKITTDEF